MIRVKTIDLPYRSLNIENLYLLQQRLFVAYIYDLKMSTKYCINRGPRTCIIDGRGYILIYSSGLYSVQGMVAVGKMGK